LQVIDHGASFLLAFKQKKTPTWDVGVVFLSSPIILYFLEIIEAGMEGLDVLWNLPGGLASK
jgi:hypothetical protein